MRPEVVSGLYSSKEAGYFAAARLDLLAMLPHGGKLSILEIGAGDGATLRAAKAMRLASYVVGMDIVQPAATAGDSGVDRFVLGNIETMDPDLAAESFDAILCGDVLEHLVDPWRTLARVTAWIKPGGILVSSIPNIRNHRALRTIVLGGDFRYADAGLLDRSHLRFFCRRNVRELHEQAGLIVEKTETNMGGYGLRHRAFDFMTLGLLHDFFVFQYRTLARKP